MSSSNARSNISLISLGLRKSWKLRTMVRKTMMSMMNAMKKRKRRKMMGSTMIPSRLKEFLLEKNYLLLNFY